MRVEMVHLTQKLKERNEQKHLWEVRKEMIIWLPSSMFEGIISSNIGIWKHNNLNGWGDGTQKEKKNRIMPT